VLEVGSIALKLLEQLSMLESSAEPIGAGEPIGVSPIVINKDDVLSKYFGR
jgi:hypothetical protein